MNIKELHQILSDLINKGHGLEDVAINKRTFNSCYEDEGGVILTVEKAKIEDIETQPFEGPESEDSFTEKFLVLRGEVEWHNHGDPL